MLGALAIFDGVALKAVALPHVRRLFAKGAAHHANLGCDHERRVEAHTKLADDVDITTLALGVFLLEFLATRMGDGAQIALQILRGHADAVIGNGQRARVLVERDSDSQVVGV